MTTKVQDLTKQIDKLAGRKESIPAELAGVRDKLEAAKTDLGRASLDGKATDRVRARVAELVGQEAELAAVLSAADLRLEELSEDLEEARRAELVKLLQDTDAKLMDDAESLLAELYDILDRTRATMIEYQAVTAKVSPNANLPTGPLEMSAAAGLAGEVYRALLAPTRSAEIRFSLSGTPARFGKLIQANRWKHVK